MKKTLEKVIKKSIESTALFEKNTTETRRDIRKAVRNGLTQNGFPRDKYKIACNEENNRGYTDCICVTVYYKKGKGFRYLDCKVFPSKKAKL